ncbi:hypothetical protein HRbin39_01874 [bacterium HR39]|nr:hypothetical protein HRbin39_01874 [bacterium HR39]
MRKPHPQRPEHEQRHGGRQRAGSPQARARPGAPLAPQRREEGEQGRLQQERAHPGRQRGREARCHLRRQRRRNRSGEHERHRQQAGDGRRGHAATAGCRREPRHGEEERCGKGRSVAAAHQPAGHQREEGEELVEVEGKGEASRRLGRSAPQRRQVRARCQRGERQQGIRRPQSAGGEELAGDLRDERGKGRRLVGKPQTRESLGEGTRRGRTHPRQGRDRQKPGHEAAFPRPREGAEDELDEGEPARQREGRHGAHTHQHRRRPGAQGGEWQQRRPQPAGGGDRRTHRQQRQREGEARLHQPVEARRGEEIGVDRDQRGGREQPRHRSAVAGREVQGEREGGRTGQRQQREPRRRPEQPALHRQGHGEQAGEGERDATGQRQPAGGEAAFGPGFLRRWRRRRRSRGEDDGDRRAAAGHRGRGPGAGRGRRGGGRRGGSGFLRRGRRAEPGELSLEADDAPLEFT